MSGFIVPVFPDLPFGFPVIKRPYLPSLVQTSGAGREVRSRQQTVPCWEYELTFEALRDQTLNADIYQPLAGFTDYQQLLGLFLNNAGRWAMFWFNDVTDNSRSGQQIGTGDAAETKFTVARSWGTGANAVSEPVGGVNDNAGFNVYLNGVIQLSGYSLYNGEDGTGAYVQFSSPPGSGVIITADFYFYYLCFFTEDQHDYEEYFKNYYGMRSLKFRSTVPHCEPAMVSPPSPPPPPTPPPPAPPNPCGTLATPSGGVWDNTSGFAGMQTYSGGNTIVTPYNNTSPFSGYPSTVWRSTTSHSTGRYWFEVHANAGNSMPLLWQLVGIANSSFPHTGASAQLGGTLDGAGIGGPFLGTIGFWINAVRIHSLGGFVSGRSVLVCVNFDLQLIWIQTSPTTFNLSSTASPNANLGGWDFSSLNAGPYRITMSQIVQYHQPYAPLTIITNDNVADALSSPPSCYVPW